jgi:hypothetical protein
MKTFDSSTSGEHLSSQIADLLDKLRAVQKPRFSTYFLPFVLAAAFGVIAWSNGRAYAVVYFGALTVAFVLHEISRRTTRREIDLVVALLGAQQKKHDSTNAT